MFATSAQAATPTAPTLTLTAPAQVDNVGTPVANGVNLRVNNTQSGNGAIAGASLSVVLTGIAGLPCNTITLTPENTGPSSAGTFISPTLATPAGITPCTFTNAAFSQGANTDVTYNYDISVIAPAVVGTLSGSATFSEPIVGPPAATVSATSNTTSTSVVNPAIVNPSTPAFTSTAVPTATIYHNYSFTEATNLGSPPAAWYAFGFHKDATTGIYTNTTYRFPAPMTVDGATHQVITLGGSNDFGFDTTTGKIININSLTSTNSVRYWSWILVANNGTGGAGTVVPPIGSGSQSQPTPGMILHDVDSAPFSLPILFSDVPLGRAFATEIYDLADNNDIKGYADGTFRPLLNVTRQAFVTILDGTRGTCSLFHPSPFADVPNSSVFCVPIRDLYEAGIVNGYSDGKFHPAALVTRQAMSAFLYRANAVWNLSISDPGDAVCTTPVPFNDISGNPFCGDIEWMAANHIANGYADGGFHPRAYSTRQATAAFIDRFNAL